MKSHASDLFHLLTKSWHNLEWLSLYTDTFLEKSEVFNTVSGQFQLFAFHMGEDTT